MRISACVITKNEEQNLPACLESIKSIVTEIIVVDTGSTDKTLEIAKQFNAKIYEFDWVNDFSKARNFAISKATGEWIIFLDADERFDLKSVESIIPIIKLAKKQKKQAIACLLSNLNKDNQLMSSFLALRIFKREPHIKYKGSIHEYISYRNGTIQAFNALTQLQIWHTGYSTEEVERKNKGERNRELLLKELELSPTSSDINFYISEAYFIDNNYEPGLEYALKAKELNTWKMFGLAQKNYLNILKIMTYKLKYHYEKISDVCQNALKEFPTFPDFNIFQAELLLLENRYEDAIEFYNIAKNNMDEVFTSQSSSYKNLDLILGDLAKCYYKTNNLKLSIENYVESLKFNKYNLKSIVELLAIISKYDSAIEIERFLKKIYDISSPRDTLYLLKASLLISKQELSQSFYSYLDQESRDSFKQEEADLLLLSGEYETALEKFNLLYEETNNQSFQEKSFVASLLAGEQVFDSEIKKTIPSLKRFGNLLKGSDLNIIEGDQLSILNVVSELIKLSKEDFLLENIENLYEVSLCSQVAEILYKNEKFESAITFYNHYLNYESNISQDTFAATLVKMAVCLYQLRQYELAIEFLNDAKNLKPEIYQIYELGIRISKELQDKKREYYFVHDGQAQFPNSNYFKSLQKELPIIEEAMKTSIIILTWNKLEYTQLCIESIRNHTTPGTYEIIIIDNNSSDGTVEWLKTQNDIKVIYNSQNIGFPAGCNQGIEVATGENILLLNNDVIVTENWLHNLVHCLYSSNNIGAVGAVTNNASYYQAINVNYNSIEELHKFAKDYNVSDESKWEERLKLIGFCMLIKKSVIDEVGILDELFTPGNYEDDDFSLRIRKAGYRLFLCKDTFIHHFGSTSFKENPTSFLSLLKQNEKKFENKWGFNPSYSLNIRHDLIDLMDRDLNKNINVLEVGCAGGATLLKIKSIYKNANLFGLELNKDAAGIASSFAEVKFENIENDLLNYPDNFFDYILFGDVLEHLYDPWKVVRKVRNYLKNDGKLLISIPNVMHYSLLKGLINGNWTYTDSGLLDRTHLRFFTYNEVQKMLVEAGFENQEYKITTVGKTEEDEEFIKALCKLTTKDNEVQYNAYQYLIKAYKNNTKVNDCEQGIKFLVRRIENDIDRTQSLDQLTQKLFENELNTDQILNTVHKDIIQKELTLNLIAVTCFEKGLYDFVIPILRGSYEINPRNTDTLYNLGMILYKMGELELSYHYLNEITQKDQDVIETIERIKDVCYL